MCHSPLRYFAVYVCWGFRDAVTMQESFLSLSSVSEGTKSNAESQSQNHNYIKKGALVSFIRNISIPCFPMKSLL